MRIFKYQNVPVGDIGGGFNFNKQMIAFDETGQRVFTANRLSDSVSIIDLTMPTLLQMYLFYLLEEMSQVAISFDAKVRESLQPIK